MMNKILLNLRKMIEYYKDKIRMNKIKKELLSRGFTKEFTKYLFTLAKSDTLVVVNLGLWYINKDDKLKEPYAIARLVAKYYEGKQ